MSAVVAREVLQQALPGLQSHGQHADVVEHTVALAEQEIDQLAHHHEERLSLHKNFHRQNRHLTRTLHTARMSLDTDLARRESIRDVFTHRSQAIQTTMIVNALMIGCVFAMIYQFVPPIESPPGAIGAYSTMLALSLLFLCGSTFSALQLQARMVRYDIHRKLMRYRCGLQHPTFSSYFDCHCAFLETLSIKLFYCGASLTITSAAILMYLTFEFTFKTQGAAILMVVLCSIGIVLLWVLDQVVSSSTHSGATDLTGVHSSGGRAAAAAAAARRVAAEKDGLSAGGEEAL